MKTLHRLLFLILISGAVACCKEEPAEEQKTVNNGIAKGCHDLDDTLTTSNNIAYYDCEQITIISSFVGPDYSNTFSISVVPAIGTYTFVEISKAKMPGTAFGRASRYGSFTFTAIKNSGYAAVTAFDPEKKTISGYYSFTIIDTNDPTRPPREELISCSFTNVKFTGTPQILKATINNKPYYANGFAGIDNTRRDSVFVLGAYDPGRYMSDFEFLVFSFKPNLTTGVHYIGSSPLIQVVSAPIKAEVYASKNPYGILNVIAVDFKNNKFLADFEFSVEDEHGDTTFVKNGFISIGY